MNDTTNTTDIIEAADHATPAMNRIRRGMRKVKEKQRDVARGEARLEKARQRDAERWFEDAAALEAWSLLDQE